MLAVGSTALRSTADKPLAVAATARVSELVYVQFRLETADASDVRLAGSFTHWQPEISAP